MATTIVIPVYNQYELFRQCIESIHHNMLHEAEEIIIVDDYSDPDIPLKPYENYLAENIDKIRVIQSDEYRMSVHSGGRYLDIAKKRGDQGLNRMDITKPTRGHGFALQTGINAAKTDFVMCLDADCVILKNAKEMLNEIEELFKSHPDIMCIGQLAGLMSNENTILKESFKYSMHGVGMNFGGCPGSPAFFCRINKDKDMEIKDDRLDPPVFANGPMHRGWALSAYVRDLFNQGYGVMNYPVFSQKKVFHVGGGILNAARFYGEAGIKNARWGMLKDGNQYGGRRGPDVIADWYQGRYILDTQTRAYMKYLEDKYNKPFDQIQPSLDESLLYVAGKEIKPEKI